MLYIVLFLVAAALGGVVAALITADSLWAWISIGLSVLAGIILLIDWFRRRSGGKGTAAKPADDTTADEDDSEVSAERDSGEPVDETSADADSDTAPAETETAGETTEVAATDTTAGLPGEEDTDAADLLIVSELDVEVVVVDESPRYHLGECGWLAERETIPLPVSEARDLGFSPCARCGPDAALAAKHRDDRKKFRSRTDR